MESLSFDPAPHSSVSLASLSPSWGSPSSARNGTREAVPGRDADSALPPHCPMLLRCRHITGLICTAAQLWQCAGRRGRERPAGAVGRKMDSQQGAQGARQKHSQALQSSVWMSLASSARKSCWKHHPANPYHLARSDITRRCFPADGHGGRQCSGSVPGSSSFPGSRRQESNALLPEQAAASL